MIPRRLHLHLAVRRLAELALRPGHSGPSVGRRQPRPGSLDGTTGRCRHGSARSGQPVGADRRRRQDQRDRGRTAQRRVRALLHRPPPRRRYRCPGPGRPSRRGRRRNGARRHRQLQRSSHPGPLVRLARRPVPDRLFGPGPGQRGRLARRCYGSDAGGLRTAGASTCALRGATGRHAGIRNKSLPDLGQLRIYRTTTDQGRARAPVVRHPAPIR